MGPFLNQIAGFLRKAGLTANVATYLGVAFSILPAFCIVEGWFLLAALGLLFAGFFDLMDGRIARTANEQSRFGALLDSSLDRYSDALYLGALIYYFFASSEPIHMMLSVSALVGSFEISYVRARAQGLSQDCGLVGYWQRVERIVLIGVAFVLDNARIAVWILGIMTHWSAWQRLNHVRRALAHPAKKEDFELKRYSWTYASQTLVYVVIVLLVRP